MNIVVKKYKEEDILNFDESQWRFRRDSGYAGYESTNGRRWIYEEEFRERKALKAQYEYDSKLLRDFRTNQLELGVVPDYKIIEFLNAKYFL